MLVLILIVVDNGLVPRAVYKLAILKGCLNPYCSGQWSRTSRVILWKTSMERCLNPYCSGQWSRTLVPFFNGKEHLEVLILIVVDNGLVPDSRRNRTDNQHQVLILIVVDNGLVPAFLPISSWFSISLNPYCSGQWSRTKQQDA